MDPQLLEKAIIDRKEKTGKYPKAIIPVALYGMPYHIDKIMAIADKYSIPVVEDAAEGMGSRFFDPQVLGTFGRYGVLSFNGNKMITTSGGGAPISVGIQKRQMKSCGMLLRPVMHIPIISMDCYRETITVCRMYVPVLVAVR